MKTKYILTASTLILALASCTSEVEEAISSQKVPLQITASIERDSRAAGVEDTDFKEGESISFGCYQNPWWPQSAMYDGKEWKLDRDIMLDNTDHVLQAMYPKHSGEFWLDDDVWDQIVNPFKAGTNYLLSNKVIVNNTNPVAHLKFRHLMSRVRFAVTNPDAKRLASIVISGDKIYETAMFISDANLEKYVFADAFPGEISVVNDNAEAAELQNIDALLIPSSHGDATLTLHYEGGKTYTTTVTLPELKMGDYYRVPITISGGEVTPEPIGKDVETFEVNGVKFNMIKVEAGTFEMGKSADGDDITPVHSVTLTKDYYIGETEVTQALWQAVTGYSPTSSGNLWWVNGTGDNHPAYFLNYEIVQDFISKLNQQTGQQFRMPTEAEWEYAAKGGNKSKGYIYSGSNDIGDVAWYYDNCDYKSHPIKIKSPNELGIYDMSGNMWEWCSDWYGSYSSAAEIDPTGPASGSERVMRGGCYGNVAKVCRTVRRSSSNPTSSYDYNGFRLALSLSK